MAGRDIRSLPKLHAWHAMVIAELCVCVCVSSKAVQWKRWHMCDLGRVTKWGQRLTAVPAAHTENTPVMYNLTSSSLFPLLRLLCSHLQAQPRKKGLDQPGPALQEVSTINGPSWPAGALTRPLGVMQGSCLVSWA